MKDALQLILSLFNEAHAFRKWFKLNRTTAQSEIDEEARRLIARHRERAIEVAEGFVQRAKRTKDQKQYARVLKAVKQALNETLPES